MDKSKLIAKADALAGLEGHEGWLLVQQYFKDMQELSLEHLANRKYTKTMDEVAWYQSMYQHAGNFLAWVDRTIEQGKKAREKSDAA